MKDHLKFSVLAALLFSISIAQAREWFVRAGSRGDGTKENPFTDPYQALKEAEPGDNVHVTRGVYHGKLNSANWAIATPNLTWLGGYNDDFTQRDRWRFPSELRFSKAFLGKNDRILIDEGQNSENFLLDGFVLDQRDPNEDGQQPYPPLVYSNDPACKAGARPVKLEVHFNQ